MTDKKVVRLRRARKTRAKIRELEIPRLTVHRTPQHIYVQVICATGDKVIATASSVEKDFKTNATKEKGKIAIAKRIGETIAKRALEKGITNVAFDRSGFKYHGRVKAVAEGARENGLIF